MNAILRAQARIGVVVFGMLFSGYAFALLNGNGTLQYDRTSTTTGGVLDGGLIFAGEGAALSLNGFIVELDPTVTIVGINNISVLFQTDLPSSLPPPASFAFPSSRTALASFTLVDQRRASFQALTSFSFSDSGVSLPQAVMFANVIESFCSGDTCSEHTLQDVDLRLSFGGAPLQVAAPIPEPETYAMLLAGLGLLGVMTPRGKQKEVAAVG